MQWASSTTGHLRPLPAPPDAPGFAAIRPAFCLYVLWLVTRDTLSQIVGRLLRIPVNRKPLTIIDLSGIPTEIADVVVSLTCRLTFDFALWSERERMPPVLLVCEEAHR
jgi:hypothetical protein